MLRGLMLTLVLLLITLTAANLGQDGEFMEVLRRAKTPIESSAGSSDTSPPPRASSDAAVPSESTPPRFVLDAPLESVPLISETPSEHALDPSAKQKLSSAEEQSMEDYVAHVPTEQEARAVAESYVKELYALTTRNLAELDQIERNAMTEYLELPPAERSGALPALAERYFPLVSRLETRADAEAERIFNRMTAALVAIGADDGIAQEARHAYSAEKTAKASHYMELFGTLQSESNIAASESAASGEPNAVSAA